MLGILIDAVVLIVLLNVISDEEMGLGKACLIAFVASVGTWLLAFGLGLALGIAGVVIAASLAAGLLGVAVSAMFGVEIKRAMAIGGIFIVIHFAVGFGFGLIS
ncbi:MAG: hypothetical protein ACKV0T_01285 [Planctomycetales bacterium]